MKQNYHIFSVLLVAIALAVVLLFPGPLNGEDNPDYWCGWRCDQGTSCWRDSSVAEDDACVWSNYSPWRCLTDISSHECSSGSGL